MQQNKILEALEALGILRQLEELKKSTGKKVELLGGATVQFLRHLADVTFSNLVDGEVLKYDASLKKWTNKPDASGTGDVVGPVSSVNENIAVFDGVTGKLIKDGGKKISEIDTDIAGKLDLDGSNANTTIDIQGENLVNVGNLGVGTASPTSSFSIYKPSTQPTADMGYGGLTMPNFSTIFPSLGTGIFKYETYVSGAYGGAAINGFTDSDTGATAFLFSGYQGSTTPTATNMLFRTAKHNGATSATGLAWAETAFQFRNWTSNLITVLGSGSTGFGTETPTAQLQVNTLSASRIAQIVRGATSQTANLTEWQDSSGTVGSAFTSDTSKLLLGTGTNNTTSSRLFVTETSTAPTEISQIYAQRLMTNPLTNRGSTNISIQVAQTSASYSGQNIGTISQAWIRNTNTQNWTASGIVNQLGLVGLEARVEVRSGASGTLSWLTGLVTDADFNSNSTATVTNYAGFKIFEPVNASSLLGFTNNYGLYVANMSAATNNYAILTNAGNIVFNEGGDASTDFRVESDTEANMLFLDANGDTDGALYLGGTTNGIKITKGGIMTFLGTSAIAGGATGTFTTSDAKTVTVTNGIITSII